MTGDLRCVIGRTLPAPDDHPVPPTGITGFCGSQAFIATLLFDPLMSALPIIVKQSSSSVSSTFR